MDKVSSEKLNKNGGENQNLEVLPFLKKILSAESSFFWMSAIYGLAISFLSLAVPLSVQFFINSISFTALIAPAVVLGTVLLILLIFWAALNALQFFVTEIFQSRFFARITSEVTILLLKSKQQNQEKREIVNRFFETITIQKIIPKFLTKTFATILQGAVGLIVVSSYHPVFFVFSLIIVISLWLIWSRFYKKAVISSFAKSQSKYDIVKCLEEIEKNSDSVNYNSEQKINSLTGLYLKERKLRFRSLFSQVILLLLLYALASVSLIVIGGWLVLKGQLTIGQLVAAELIISALLYNFSQLGRDLESFYDLAASCQKLSKFYNFSIEKKDFELFTNFNNINIPKPLKVLPKIILTFLSLAILILCLTPWQQTSKGFGHIIATDD
jgi:putative ABC transport system ATP-binding protein